MKAPTQHLIDTVNALDERLQAALILVFVHQGDFNPSSHDCLAAQAVTDLTGYSIAKIQDCFAELNGSFLKRSGPSWTFAHPTISDALTKIMRQKPHMMAALVRGAPIDTILDSFTCEGTPPIRDALVIPAVLNDALVARLGRTPNERYHNWRLFHFLSRRASEDIFEKTIEQFPDLLRRSCWQADSIRNDPQVAAYSRANRLGLLPDDLRRQAAERLEAAAQTDLDVSFFEEEDMLALLPPMRLVSLGMALRTIVLPSLNQRIDNITENADLDEEPDSHFKRLLDLLERIEAIGVDDDAVALIEDARDQVRCSVNEIEERMRERDDETDSDIDWTHIVTQEKEEAAASATPPATRSIFDDVDK